MRRHIAANYGTGSDHRPFADGHVRQDDTVRSDKHIFLDGNFSVAHRPSPTGVNVRDDRCSKPDDAVIANAHVGRMDFIDVDKLANPDILADRHSAQPLQPGSHLETTRRDERDFADESAEENWQSQTFSILTFRCRSSILGWTREVLSNFNLSYSIHCSVFPLRRTLTGA